MDNTTQWSVDRLAASNLLAQLKLETSDDLVDLVAQHFAEHRRNLVPWAVKRMRSAIIARMESAAASLFSHHGDDWARGFAQAEEIVVTLEAKALFDFEPDPPRSKGQILRSMVRQARQR